MALPCVVTLREARLLSGCFCCDPGALLMASIEAVVERLVMAGGRLAAMLVAGLLCGVVLAGAAHAQGQDELTQLFAEVGRLLGQGKSADAVPIAEKAVALARERHGEEHALFGSALGWLAIVYWSRRPFVIWPVIQGWAGQRPCARSMLALIDKGEPREALTRPSGRRSWWWARVLRGSSREGNFCRAPDTAASQVPRLTSGNGTLAPLHAAAPGRQKLDAWRADHIARGAPSFRPA